MSTPAAAAPRLGADYWRLWSVTVVSAAGDGVRLVAMPLLAARITHDPLAVSLAAAAASLPWLLCSLISGVLVDRLDRRGLLWRCNVLQAAVMGVFTLAVAAGRVGLPALVAVAFAVAALQTVVDLAAQAALPSVVARDRLHAANGRLQAGTRVCGQLAGPALGGVLFAGGPAVPFVVDAVSFAAAALIVRGIRLPVPARRPGRARAAELGEGLVWLARHRLLRVLCLALFAWGLADMAVLALLPLYAMESLGLPESGVGLLLGVSAVGAVLGSLAAPGLARRVGTRAVVCGVFAVTAVGYGLLGAAADAFVAAAALLLLGAVGGLWVVVVTALRQSLIPDRLLGRVTSAYRLVGFGSRPAGAALGGLLAREAGLDTPFLAAAVAMGVLSLSLAAGRAMRPGPRRSRPPAAGPATPFTPSRPPPPAPPRGSGSPPPAAP